MGEWRQECTMAVCLGVCVLCLCMVGVAVDLGSFLCPGFERGTCHFAWSVAVGLDDGLRFAGQLGLLVAHLHILYLLQTS